MSSPASARGRKRAKPWIHVPDDRWGAAKAVSGDLELPRVTTEEDIASVAGQLADLTRKVDEMQRNLIALGERADNQQKQADTQQERAEIQQERIELAARELADVSDRLQAAANALRESM